MLKNVSSSLISVKIGSVNITNVNITLNKVLGFPVQGGFLQMVPLKMVSSPDHLFFAAEQAASAFAPAPDSAPRSAFGSASGGKTALAKTPSLEFLLRFTARKQIGKALDEIKFVDGKNDVVVIILANSKAQLQSAEKFLKKELDFKPQSEKQAAETIQKNVKKNFSYLKKTYSITDAELNALSDFGKTEALQNAVLEKIALVRIDGR